jgi:hypothetical protein
MKNKFTQLVELVVPPAGSTLRRIQFVDQPYLRGAFIYGVEAYCTDDIVTSPQGNAVITTAQMKNAYITFYTTDPLKGGQNIPTSGGQGSGEYIQLLPLINLHTLQNAATTPFERWPFELAGQSIIWEKTYITLGAGLGNSGNLSFLLNINFELNPQNTTN